MPVLRIEHTTEEFKEWLNELLFRQFGLRFTIVMLSERTGLSHNTLSDALKGRRIPSEETLDKLADLLGVDRQTMKRRAGRAPMFELDTVNPPDDVALVAERDAIVDTLRLGLKLLLV